MKKVRTDWSLDERLRSLLFEKLIESEYLEDFRSTKKDGACIYFEFCGEEMGIEASYLDYMAERRRLCIAFMKKPRVTQKNSSKRI